MAAHPPEFGQNEGHVRVDSRRASVALVVLLILAGLALAPCGTGNEVPGKSSGIRKGAPAPTIGSATAPEIPTGSAQRAATSVVPAQSSPTSTQSAQTASPTSTSLPSTGSPASTVKPVPEPPDAQTPVPTTVAPIQSSPLTQMEFERVYSWYSPQRPTHLEEARDGSGRVYVSEQAGRLIELTGNPTAATGSIRTVLDITEIATGRATEEGFLGFALHPDAASNSHIYVYYSATDPRRSVISEFTFLLDGIVDPNSERVVMEVSQPRANHNGGMLAFGPDGFLYIGLGDGGGAGDQSNNAQNISNVLGTILRIDVDAPGLSYAVPSDNPFVQRDESAPEIWAYGLRNPWRFSFDGETGDLWAGDVGQNQLEEIDLITRGGNYGWRLKEGPDCFTPTSGCEQTASISLIDPVASYSHGSGCSVSGGYVYRGDRLPSLYGAYIYADFCSGIVWALRHANGEVTEQLVLADTSHQVPAFGQTLDGEVYMLTYSPGIFRFIEK